MAIIPCRKDAAINRSITASFFRSMLDELKVGEPGSATRLADIQYAEEMAILGEVIVADSNESGYEYNVVFGPCVGDKKGCLGRLYLTKHKDPSALALKILAKVEAKKILSGAPMKGDPLGQRNTEDLQEFYSDLEVGGFAAYLLPVDEKARANELKLVKILAAAYGTTVSEPEPFNGKYRVEATVEKKSKE